MQSRNGRPAPPGTATGSSTGTVHVKSPDAHPASEDLPEAPGTAEAGPAAADRPEAPPAQPVPGQLPPDRPRPRETGPPPPVPAELPKRKADPARPSVPTRLPKRPGTAAGEGRPAQAARPGAPGESGPSLPPELFHPLWWQERPSPPPPPPEPGPPAPSPPAQRPPAQPSWASVLATTVRLWLRRRLGWMRRLWPARPGQRAVIVVALAAAVLAAGAAAGMLSRPGPAGQAAPGTGAPTATAALAGAAAARQQAAAWVASQVSPAAIVACDPAMCAALQARGLPAGRLLVLTPAQADPLGSDVVVATPAVRGQFGARLAGVYAPVTVAAFGSGAARIDVRAVAPAGAAAYRAALAADVRARRAAGALMLRNTHIHVAAAARAALAAGEVDPRLLVTLATLAHLHALDITGFGDPGPGASAGVPLRSADITGAAPPGSRGAVPLPALMAVLRAQRPPYLPSSLAVVRVPPGGLVLRIAYPAPSPLGLLGTGG